MRCPEVDAHFIRITSGLILKCAQALLQDGDNSFKMLSILYNIFKENAKDLKAQGFKNRAQNRVAGKNQDQPNHCPQQGVPALFNFFRVAAGRHPLEAADNEH